MSEVNGLLLNDTEMILNRSVDVELRSTISDLNAFPDQVEEWYFNSDPLEIDRRFDVIERLTAQQHDTAIDIQDLDYAVVMESAALTLIAGALNPEVFEQDEPWTAYYENTTTADGIVDRRALLSAVLQSLPEKAKTLSITDIERLRIAHDCLGISSKHFLDIFDRAAKSGPNYDLNLRQSLMARSSANMLKCLSLAITIRNICLDQAEGGADYEDIEKLLDIALEANLWSSFATAGIDQYVTGDTLKSAFVNNAYLIRQRYLDSVVAPKKISGSQKGLLHQAIWLLDANFMISNHDELKKTKVLPTSLRVDRPEIGHPKLKRGYDVNVILPISDQNLLTRTLPVQLKSSKGLGHKGNYHPGILLLEEANFMDVDKRRLSKKLNLYKKWAEADFDEAIGRQIQAMVLPTVHEFIAKSLEAHRMSDMQYLRSRNPEMRLNRPERRRLERALAKLASNN